MGDIAVRAEGLGKRYLLGERLPYRTLRDSLARAARVPFRALTVRRREAPSQGLPASPRYLWALREVSLEVKRGEAVAIVGRNGSGKSTLLKLLARITEPTQGWAEVQGRVGALLEVGTGFHPELTGRENIFLNGVILGLNRAEIRRRFDEIVAFSELEKFLDTPVKHYSSGMYVRLAFSVAAHFVPDVLLLDEVFAVGDHAFRQKCHHRLRETLQAGTTVLLVTHDPAVAEQWCSRAVWLEGGQVRADGPSASVVQAYVASQE
ncbi:MAG: ABC transporter ATP-binding protein [Candidatus Bipolaricaulota bacterium]|nr:ABC transporter ATP-binding protein [Candidatus Bipolaricaulota bacterium]